MMVAPLFNHLNEYLKRRETHNSKKSGTITSPWGFFNLISVTIVLVKPSRIRDLVTITL